MFIHRFLRAGNHGKELIPTKSLNPYFSLLK